MTDAYGNRSNFITTSHDRGMEIFANELLEKKIEKKYTLKTHTHNHPKGLSSPSQADGKFYIKMRLLNNAPFIIKIRFKEETKTFNMIEK